MRVCGFEPTCRGGVKRVYHMLCGCVGLNPHVEVVVKHVYHMLCGCVGLNPHVEVVLNMYTTCYAGVWV